MAAIYPFNMHNTQRVAKTTFFIERVILELEDNQSKSSWIIVLCLAEESHTVSCANVAVYWNYSEVDFEFG